MTISPFSLGIAAGLSASAIWGGALAVTRLGVSGEAPLGPTDIAMPGRVHGQQGAGDGFADMRLQQGDAAGNDYW